MSSQVISRLVSLNFNFQKCIDLTEKRQTVIIGSDDLCRNGYIFQHEHILAPFHCYIYLERNENQQCWNTFIKEKAVNTRIYETWVNQAKLKARETERLCDNDEIKIGMKENHICFGFYDEHMRREQEKIVKVPESLSKRFKNYYDELARGAHAIVYNAQDIKDATRPKDCVCKIVYLSKNVTPYAFNNLCQEPIILNSLSHPNIIKVLGHYRDINPDRLLIWQEMMHGENLGQYFKRVKAIGENEWCDISFQILDALKYLHEKDIVHRDIKPDNIMWVDRSCSTLKLIDFGLAKNGIESSDRDMGVVGTPLYTPPEIYVAFDAGGADVYDLYNPSVDIWAYGVLSFLFLAGRTPFSEDEGYVVTSSDIVGRVIQKEPLEKKNINEFIVQLIVYKILIHDHEKRMTAHEIMDFLTKYCSEKSESDYNN